MYLSILYWNNISRHHTLTDLGSIMFSFFFPLELWDEYTLRKYSQNFCKQYTGVGLICEMLFLQIILFQMVNSLMVISLSCKPMEVWKKNLRNALHVFQIPFGHIFSFRIIKKSFRPMTRLMHCCRFACWWNDPLELKPVKWNFGIKSLRELTHKNIDLFPKTTWVDKTTEMLCQNENCEILGTVLTPYNMWQVYSCFDMGDSLDISMKLKQRNLPKVFLCLQFLKQC